MAHTVDPAAPSSPAMQADEQPDAARADETEVPPDARSAGPESNGEKPEPEETGSVTELFEQLGRELAELFASEAQLEAARNLPEVRRSARDIAGALVVVVASLTAFAFVNVAAMDGLSKLLPTWLAALVLAAVWAAVGGVLLFGFMGRARQWLMWIVVKAPPKKAVEELKQERDAAGKTVRSTLEQLGPALAIQVALAAVPEAGEVAGSVIEVGDSVLEASEETVEVIAEELPGGGMVNQAWSVALMPGRFGIRIATTVLRRRQPAD
jgi:hypothetical protein